MKKMDYEKKYKAVLETAKQWVKDGCSDKERICLESVFPELRESEDERTGNVIYCIVRDNKEVERILEGNGISVDNALAYLEKQKEHLRDSAKMVEQESIDGKALLHTADKSYRIGYRDGFNAKMPVMPPEWSEEDEVYLQDALWCVKQASKVARGENDMGACWSAERWLKSLPEKLVLQPKQEWSKEEDKTNGWTGEDSRRYLSCLQRLGTGNPQQPETINSKWFKEHCRPQLQQEWSEEDEDAYNQVYYLFRDAIDEWYKAIFSGCYPKITRDKVLAMLKPLRPQAQQNMSIGFMLYLDEHRPDGKMCLSNAECNEIETAFKNQSWDTILRYAERYYPHWKPSEEQMKSLLNAEGKMREIGFIAIASNLAELYEQLKKLM